MQFFLILISLSFALISQNAFSEQTTQATQEMICKSKADPLYEIRLKLEDKRLKGVSFAKEDWSTKGAPYFDVVQVESKNTPAFLRYNKVGKDSAYIYIDPNVLTGASGILVSDDIAYRCILDDK